MEAVTVYLGLGSNVGDRAGNLDRAVTSLSKLMRLRCRSSIYQTEPWGYIDQPRFLNCVVSGETVLPPVGLLEGVKSLEREMGRQPGLRYGPRLIDVDVLLYGKVEIDLPDLQVPHPKLSQRAFVLVPLCELAPDLVHPALGLTIAKLTEQVEGKEGVKLWSPPA